MHSPEVDNARWLRNNMTETERRVWSRLRGRQVGGYKFRRQVPVGPYVVDFMCVSDRLAVEVDGPHHEDEEADKRKTKFLQAHGYRVLRIPVGDVDESRFWELNFPTRCACCASTPASPLRGEARPAGLANAVGRRN